MNWQLEKLLFHNNSFLQLEPELFVALIEMKGKETRQKARNEKAEVADEWKESTK